MSKRIIGLVLVLAIMVCCATSVFAAERGNVRVSPSLKFSGTTAQCSALVTSANDSLNVTMELRCGSAVIGTWYGNGTSAVTVSGSAAVAHGQTYTLVVYGTVNGNSFPSTTVTKVCP